MDIELIHKIKAMFDSNDEELLELARFLFWNNNPTYEDYLELMPHSGSTKEEFEHDLPLIKEEMKNNGYIRMGWNMLPEYRDR